MTKLFITTAFAGLTMGLAAAPGTASAQAGETVAQFYQSCRAEGGRG